MGRKKQNDACRRGIGELEGEGGQWEGLEGG